LVRHKEAFLKGVDYLFKAPYCRSQWLAETLRYSHQGQVLLWVVSELDRGAFGDIEIDVAQEMNGAG